MNIEIFNSLPQHAQRILIASDVIENVKIGVYSPHEGSYIEINSNQGAAFPDDIQKDFDKINGCNVCAIGSCLLSLTKFKNTLTKKILIV